MPIDDNRLPSPVEAAGLLNGSPADDRRVVTELAQRLCLSPLDWMTVADLATLGRCPDDAPLVCALALLFEALDEGSLCIDIQGDPTPVGPDTGRGGEVSAMLDRFSATWRRGGYRRLDGSCLVLDACGGSPLLYFQKFHHHERRLAEHLKAFAARPDFTLEPERVAALIDDLYTPPRAVRTGQPARPVARDAGQEQALAIAMRAPLAVISGGPGTGKTSLMVNILRGLTRLGDVPAREIVLTAPTGRAAQRMTSALRRHLESVQCPYRQDAVLACLEGRTLHRVLRYRHRSRDFFFDSGNPLPAAAVVVDEVSMVDVELMERFLAALDPLRTRLIFLGDRDQLPAVAAGAVLAQLVPAEGKPGPLGERQAVLTRVFRSGRNLAGLARSINRGHWPPSTAVELGPAMEAPADNWFRIPCENARQWESQLAHWARRRYLFPAARDGLSPAARVRHLAGSPAGELLNTGESRRHIDLLLALADRFRALSVLRSGPLGCRGVNAAIARFAAGPGGLPLHPGGRIFAGQPVMVTRNDYARGLVNGDTGIALRSADGGWLAVFGRGETLRAHPLDLLPAWEPADCITVHKSQGSEFDDVLLVLPDDGEHRLLTREIVYTAVTRARGRVYVRGMPSVLAAAAARRIRRLSGRIWATDGG